jgi:hypothetical protein
MSGRCRNQRSGRVTILDPLPYGVLCAVENVQNLDCLLLGAGATM